jgi:hypothetical protein
MCVSLEVPLLLLLLLLLSLLLPLLLPNNHCTVISTAFVMCSNSMPVLLLLRQVVCDHCIASTVAATTVITQYYQYCSTSTMAAGNRTVHSNTL